MRRFTCATMKSPEIAVNVLSFFPAAALPAAYGPDNTRTRYLLTGKGYLGIFASDAGLLCLECHFQVSITVIVDIRHSVSDQLCSFRSESNAGRIDPTAFKVLGS